MFKSMISAFLLALVIGSVATQNCGPSPAADKLITGTYTFQLTPFASRVQCYTSPFDAALGSSPQITSGLTSIASFQSDSAGIDFSLRSFIVPGSGQSSFTLIVNNATWNSVQISFLLTSRSDFEVGTFLSSANALAGCNRQQPATLVIRLPPTTSIVSSQSLAVLVFINGLRTASTGLSLQFQQPIYDGNLRQINVTAISTANREIELIYFAYILADLGKLASAGFTYSFSTSPFNGNYLVSGTVGITGGNTIRPAFFSINKTNSLTCVGFTCTACQTQASCTSLGGVVSGSQCVKCNGGQVFITGVGCACSTGTNLVNGVCQACPAGTSYNAASQTCVQSCGANSFLSGSTCICSSGFFNISGSCQTCPAGTSYHAAIQTCTQICGVNSVLSGNTCICSSGFFNISGTCQVCPSGTSYNAATRNCVQNCGVNSFLSGTTCVCSSGFFNISGSCQTCPAGTSYNAASQSCINTCGANQIWSGNGCVCINGFSLINNVCQQTTATCGVNMYIQNGVCRCLPNLLQYQGACYSCPANSVVTADQTGCMCLQGFTLTSSYTCQPTSQTTVTVQSTTNLNSGSSQAANSNTGSSQSTSSNSLSSGTSSTMGTSSTTTTTTGGTFNSGTSGVVSGSSSTTSSGTSGGSSGSSTNGLSGSSTQSGSSTMTSSATTSGGSSSTTNIYGGSTSILSSTTTSTTSSSTSSCPNGARYSNGTCRPQAAIFTNQSVVILNTVYVNVIAANLPESLTNNQCPTCTSLLVASLLNAPSGVTVSINFISGTSYQWVAAIVFPGTPSTVTLQLRFNPNLSAHFAANDLTTVSTTLLNPAQIPVYTLPAQTVTNSIAGSKDLLSNSSEPQNKGVLSEVLKQFEGEK